MKILMTNDRKHTYIVAAITDITVKKNINGQSTEIWVHLRNNKSHLLGSFRYEDAALEVMGNINTFLKREDRLEFVMPSPVTYDTNEDFSDAINVNYSAIE